MKSVFAMCDEDIKKACLFAILIYLFICMQHFVELRVNNCHNKCMPDLKGTMWLN